MSSPEAREFGTERWSLLDGVSFVTGAAVASVHVRDRAEEALAPGSALGLILVPAFLLLWITAAGPFLYLVRRFVSKPPGYPASTDSSWLVQGLPWLATALVRSARGLRGSDGRGADVWMLTLLSAASFHAFATVAMRWRASAPRPSGESAPSLGRTGMIGLALAATWPLQLALWMLVGE